jgi:hypothetical protein
MQATQKCIRLSRQAATFAGLLAVLGLCSFQYGDNNGLNNMPFAQVQTFVSDLAKAQRMAQQGNVDLLAGQTISGRPVRLRGELTDANCFLSSHTHAYDHAFCAKLCIAAGSPLILVPDDGSQIYLVLTAQNGVRVGAEILDQIGVPGIVVEGKVLKADRVRALAVQQLTR